VGVNVRARIALVAGIAAAGLLLTGCGGTTAGQAQNAPDPVTGAVETRTAAATTTRTTAPAPTTPAINTAVEAAVAAPVPDIKTAVADVGNKLGALQRAAKVCGSMTATPSLVDYLHNLNGSLGALDTVIAAVRAYADSLQQDLSKAPAAGGGSDPRVLTIGSSATAISKVADDATTVQSEAALQAQTAIAGAC
jgi:hypothetical protein